MQKYAMWIAIIWAFVVIFWWSYDVLNEELQKLDADGIQRSPLMRLDRAYRIIGEHIEECNGLLQSPRKDSEPDKWQSYIRQWDNGVRTTLSSWCKPGALDYYLENSRTVGQEQIGMPDYALDALRLIHASLQIYVK
jgi:hypothetical protein